MGMKDLFGRFFGGKPAPEAPDASRARETDSSPEPMTLFSRNWEPSKAIQRLRELGADVTVQGPDHDWRRAVVGFGGSKLTFNYDPDHLAGQKGATQILGMCGYFSRFPETSRKPKVLDLIRSFRHTVGIVAHEDSRADRVLEAVSTVCEVIDGVIFSPVGLRDARGRILFGYGGADAEDPAAVWPAMDPVGEAAGMDDGGDDGDDELDEDPPTAERVARRAMALTALTARAIFEQDAGTAHEAAAAELLGRVVAWIEEVGFGDEFEDAERKVLRQKIGKLDPRSQANSTWRLEGLAVLAWALRRFELPPHDELVDMNQLWKSLGFLDAEAARKLLEAPVLRPASELSLLQNRLFALHWRLRDFSLNGKTIDFAELARAIWFGPLDISGLPLEGGDLALQGRRLDQAPGDAFSTAHSAAQERHQAANWLCEGPALYSEASVAT